MYSKSPSTGHESDAATNDTHAHIRPYSVPSSPAWSQTHSIVPSQLPGPSGIATGGQSPEHQQISAGMGAKGREARMERTTPDMQLRVVNITEGAQVDPEHPPSAPPPAYSQEAQ